MKKGGDHSIIRIRTFDEDIARVKGIEISKEPTSTIEKGPTLEKETVQGAADKILETQTRSADDFIAEDTSGKEMLAPDIEVEVDIPAEEIIATHKDTPTETKVTPPPPPVNNLVVDELEDEIRAVSKIHTQSVQTTEGAVYDVSNSDLSEGTLISDKKLTKHRLLPSMLSALTSWFTTTKTELTTPKEPEHVISSAESRIATITAAARESKHAPHSDHGVMVKRLTKEKKKPVAKAMKITKKEEVVAPQWSSVAETEVMKADEPAPVPLSTPEVIIAEPVPVEEPKVVETPPVVKPIIPTPETTSVADPIPEPTPVEELKVAKIPPVVESAPKPMVPEPTPQAVPEPTAVVTPPVEKKKKKKVPRKKRTYRATPTTTSGVSIYVYILVIVGASLLGIGVSVYWFVSATPTQEAVVIRIPSLFASDDEIAVTLGTDSNDNLSTILDLSIATRETIQIYPVITDASGMQTPADVQTTFTALGFRAPGSFARAVTDITFGSYNGTDPFILMKVTNFDTAFGGILNWEPDLSEDLAPLFGIPVTQSYDPYSRSDTQIRSAFFRDTIVANKSARLLVDAEDDERLMYSFIRPNLILMTTNSDTFNAILPLVAQ